MREDLDDWESNRIKEWIIEGFEGCISQVVSVNNVCEGRCCVVEVGLKIRELSRTFLALKLNSDYYIKKSNSTISKVTFLNYNCFAPRYLFLK